MRHMGYNRSAWVAVGNKNEAYEDLPLEPAGPGFWENYLGNMACSCQQKIAIWACRSVTQTDLGESAFS